MATVAAASDARPRRYAKEQPTAAPFPPPQADFSLAGLCAIQGVAEGRDGNAGHLAFSTCAYYNSSSVIMDTLFVCTLQVQTIAFEEFQFTPRRTLTLTFHRWFSAPKSFHLSASQRPPRLARPGTLSLIYWMRVGRAVLLVHHEAVPQHPAPTLRQRGDVSLGEL